MARYLRSTNLPFAAGTLLSPCMSCSISHTGVSAATAAPPAASAITNIVLRQRLLFPEIIKVVPVVRRVAAVMLETRHISALRLGDCALALDARSGPRIDQAFEMNVVAIAAAIEAKHQHQRPLQHGGDAERAGRKMRGLAQKPERGSPLVAKGAVAQHADDFAALERSFHFEHGVDFAELYDLQRELRIDGGEHGVELARVLRIHDKADARLRVEPAERADDFEATHVRAHQEAAAAVRHRVCLLYTSDAADER